MSDVALIRLSIAHLGQRAFELAAIAAGCARIPASARPFATGLREDGQDTDPRRDLVDRDDRAAPQGITLIDQYSHDLRSKRLGKDVLRANLKDAGPGGAACRQHSREVQVAGEHHVAPIARPLHDRRVGCPEITDLRPVDSLDSPRGHELHLLR